MDSSLGLRVHLKIRSENLSLKTRLCAPLILCAAVLTLAVNCGRDDRSRPGDTGPAGPDSAPYLGRYELSPSAQGESVTLLADGRVLYNNSRFSQEGRFHLDPVMLRIYLASRVEPTGVFLLKTFERRDWRGFWNGQVRFLKSSP